MYRFTNSEDISGLLFPGAYSISVNRGALPIFSSITNTRTQNNDPNTKIVWEDQNTSFLCLQGFKVQAYKDIDYDTSKRYVDLSNSDISMSIYDQDSGPKNDVANIKSVKLYHGDIDEITSSYS